MGEGGRRDGGERDGRVRQMSEVYVWFKASILSWSELYILHTRYSSEAETHVTGKEQSVVVLGVSQESLLEYSQERKSIKASSTQGLQTCVFHSQIAHRLSNPPKKTLNP